MRRDGRTDVSAKAGKWAVCAGGVAGWSGGLAELAVNLGRFIFSGACCAQRGPDLHASPRAAEEGR